MIHLENKKKLYSTLKNVAYETIVLRNLLKLCTSFRKIYFALKNITPGANVRAIIYERPCKKCCVLDKCFSNLLQTNPFPGNTLFPKYFHLLSEKSPGAEWQIKFEKLIILTLDFLAGMFKFSVIKFVFRN